MSDDWQPGLDYPESVHDRERELERLLREIVEQMEFVIRTHLSPEWQTSPEGVDVRRTLEAAYEAMGSNQDTREAE